MLVLHVHPCVCAFLKVLGNVLKSHSAEWIVTLGWPLRRLVRESRLQPGRSDDPDFMVLHDGFLVLHGVTLTHRFEFAILALCLVLRVPSSCIMRCPPSSTSRMHFRADLSIDSLRDDPASCNARAM